MPVVLRHADHEAGDDREVPEDRRQRRHREMVVGVEDPDDDPRDPEQDHDREEDAREPDREALVPPGTPNSRTTHGAIRMKSALSAVRPSSISQKRLDATRQARLRSPFSISSLNTGTNADDKAASATQGADQVREVGRNRERVDLALRAEVIRRDDLADQPEHAREPRRDREDDRRPRQTARAGSWIGNRRAEGEPLAGSHRPRPREECRFGRPVRAAAGLAALVARYESGVPLTGARVVFHVMRIGSGAAGAAARLLRSSARRIAGVFL